MRFLLDENQSPRLADHLVEAGRDVIHVRGPRHAHGACCRILEVAREDDRVVVSADVDFGELLARSNAGRPSILLFRRQQQRRARQLAALILANLDDVAEDLESGAVVVFDSERIRVRRLPFQPN